MQSWRRHCPNYEIIEWNAKNFDFTDNLYARQAYEARKWAFATDYARFYVLYHYGGIYMDSDMELFKPLDAFLADKAFSGFETTEMVGCSIMGAEKGHDFFKSMLESFDKRAFIRENGTFDYTPIPRFMTKYCLASDLGLNLNNCKQIMGDVTIYPVDYFYPKDGYTYKVIITPRTHAIHHGEGGWVPLQVRIWRAIKRPIRRYFPFLVPLKEKFFPSW
jgi:hypothetical protein